MAHFQRGIIVVLTLLLGAATAALAQSPPAAPIPGLYDRPVLVIDPGVHTGLIWRAAADAQGRWVVSGSDDKTVRVWSLADGGRCCAPSGCRRARGMWARPTRWR
ncbi:MAG: hypothetical protein ACJ8AW_07215 [Rhodopila sp.]